LTTVIKTPAYQVLTPAKSTPKHHGVVVVLFIKASFCQITTLLGATWFAFWSRFTWIASQVAAQ